MTFGYGRAEMVAALADVTTLVVISLRLAWEGAARLLDLQPVEGSIVAVVAGLALVVDVATAALAFRMAKGGATMRAASLHDVANALGSIGVIAAGALIVLHGWWIADPPVTLVIAACILWQSARAAGSVIRMPMPGSPAGPDTGAVLAGMEAVPGAASIHRLHLREMHAVEAAVDAPVVVEDGHAAFEARDRVERRAGRRAGGRRSPPGTGTCERGRGDARAVGR